MAARGAAPPAACRRRPLARACTPRAAAARGFGRAPPTRTPPVACPPELSRWNGSDALVQLVIAAGGWVHPALAVASRAGGERGLFALTDLPAGPLIFLPCAACISSDTADASPVAVLWARGGPLAGLDAAERLAVYLALRDATAPDAYTAALPGRGALACFPLAWSDAQRAALAHPELSARFAKRRAENDAQHGALATALAAGAAGAAGAAVTITQTDFLWSLTMVLSRVFNWHDGRGMALHPLLDCANHAPFHRSGEDAAGASGRVRNALFGYVPARTTAAAAAAAGWATLPAAAAAGGCARLEALRPLHAGEEILISYHQEQSGGLLTAQGALARYGFVPDALREAPHAVGDADARAAAAQLGLVGALGDVITIAAAGAALAAHAAADGAAAAAGADVPAAIASAYRRGRGLALGRAALSAHLQAGGDAARAALRAGIAAGARGAHGADADAGAADALAADVWRALAGEEPPLLSPATATAETRAARQR
jgi:hypothetical protein